MRGGSRYEAQGIETEFEPGSRGRVLRNLIGVRSSREMARRESEALLAATQRVIDETGVDQQFTVADICLMHHVWLGGIYAWAGAYRQVNVGKDGFMFAAANQVGRLMLEFERGPLREFTPCRSEDVHAQAHAMGVVHAELILIHPFREGNGTLCPFAGDADGLPGRIAGSGLWRDSRCGEAALRFSDPGGYGAQLFTNRRNFPRGDRPDAAVAGYRFFGMTRSARWTRPLLLAITLNGARMPSIAEELATDLSTVRSRTAGSRR